MPFYVDELKYLFWYERPSIIHSLLYDLLGGLIIKLFLESHGNMSENS